MERLKGRPTWAECAPFFQYDGALRDIYVTGVGPAAWARWLAGLGASQLRTQVSVGPLVVPLITAFPIPGDMDEDRHALWVWLACGLLLSTCFFQDDEIEVSLDPSEVGAAQAFDELLAFIELSAEAVGRETILTDENRPG